MQSIQKECPQLFIENAVYNDLCEIAPISIVLDTKYYEYSTLTVQIPFNQWELALKSADQVTDKTLVETWAIEREKRLKKPAFVKNNQNGSYYFINKVHYTEQQGKRLITLDCIDELSFLDKTTITPISMEQDTQQHKGAVGNYVHKIMEDALVPDAIEYDTEKRQLRLQGVFSCSGTATTYNVQPYDVLGETCQKMLKLHEMGLRIRNDIYIDGKRVIDVFQGKDRTQFNSDRFVFSEQFGNLYNLDVVWNESNLYSNIQAVTQFNGKVDTTVTTTQGQTVTCDARTTREGQVVDSKEFFIPYNNCMKTDKNIQVTLTQDQQSQMSANDFEMYLADECAKRLRTDCKEVTNISFDVLGVGYEFGKDFDIGDKVQVEIENLGVSQGMRVIDVSETWENNTYKVNYELGNPLKQ